MAAQKVTVTVRLAHWFPEWASGYIERCLERDDLPDSGLGACVAKCAALVIADSYKHTPLRGRP